jgi:hypothetical protein
MKTDNITRMPAQKPSGRMPAQQKNKPTPAGKHTS